MRNWVKKRPKSCSVSLLTQWWTGWVKAHSCETIQKKFSSCFCNISIVFLKITVSFWNCINLISLLTHRSIQGWIKLNKNLLDAYLGREAPMKASIKAMMRDAFLPSIPIDMLRTKISRKLKEQKHWIILEIYELSLAVQTKLFYIQGRLLRIQAKARAKVNSEKTIENLEDAIGYLHVR